MVGLASLCLLAWLSPSGAMATPGDLDETFSGNGKEGYDIGGGVQGATDIAIQRDRKILLSGFGRRTSAGPSGFAVLRLLPNGRPDRSYGRAGVAIHTIENAHPSNQLATSIALQRSGAAIVGGGVSVGTTELVPTIERFKPNGALDRSFGENGATVLDQLGDARISDLAVLPGGDVIAVATVGQYLFEGVCCTGAVIRFDRDGRLDTSFAGDGIAEAPGFLYLDLAVDRSSHTIAVTGAQVAEPDRDTAVAKYRLDGSLDSSFGDGGIVISDLGSRDEGIDLDIQTDGKLVVAGQRCGEKRCRSQLVRYRQNGRLDASFSDDGHLAINPAGGAEGGFVALQPGGGILLTVETREEGFFFRFGLARFTAGGRRDRSFASDGFQVTAVGDSIPRASMMYGSRRLLVAGTAGFGRFAVARYELSDGPPDEDADGVLDPVDRCASEFGHPPDGCPPRK
jgi:uncharacterized delta-60 repeat protein